METERSRPLGLEPAQTGNRRRKAFGLAPAEQKGIGWIVSYGNSGNTYGITDKLTDSEQFRIIVQRRGRLPLCSLENELFHPEPTLTGMANRKPELLAACPGRAAFLAYRDWSAEGGLSSPSPFRFGEIKALNYFC